MRILAVDDERAMLDRLHAAIVEAAPSAEVHDFKRAKMALAAIEEEGLVPDVVFTDIQMPGIDGMEFAKRVRAAAPNSKVVFVTAYPDYAVEAYRLHADGFVVKPVQASRVREELDAILPEREGGQKKLRVQCFGPFEVFWGDEPLVFSRAQTKELFAYLVDRKGGVCTSGEIVAALWGDGSGSRNPKAYLRVITSDLKAKLASIGMEDVFMRKHNQWAVRKSSLDCDYYRMLDGDPSAVELYYGEYMTQYSWAETTAAQLYFKSLQ